MLQLNEPLDASQMEMIKELIKQAENDGRSRISKQQKKSVSWNKVKTPYVVSGGEEIILSHGLRKSFTLQRWWLVHEEIGVGSNKTKVKRMASYFQYDATTDTLSFHDQGQQNELILKSMKRSLKMNVNHFSIFVRHECTQTRLVDPSVELTMEANNNRAYLSMFKAYGCTLLKYLSDNPHLNFLERLSLVKLLHDKILHLHEKISIAHLDLKLENVIYEQKKHEMRLVDFGSSQSVDAELGKCPSFLHITAKFVDPIDHEKSVAREVDYYLSAGLFGLILSDWLVIDEEWTEKPIMKIKKQHAANNVYVITENINERCYAFDELLNVSYIVPEEKVSMQEIIDALKKLGHEDRVERSNLRAFDTVLMKAIHDVQDLQSKKLVVEIQRLSLN